MLFNVLIWIGLAFQPYDNTWTYNAFNPAKQFQLFTEYKSNSQEDWASKNLQTGDIICVRGNQYIMRYFNFSNYICSITRSEYSHCAFIVKMGRSTYVIDMDGSGTRRMPFSLFMRELNHKKIKVVRVKEQYSQSILEASNFCWTRYFAGVQFDFNFINGGDTYYCAELICRAFHKSKLCLMQPVKVSDLPGIYDNPVENILVIYGSRLFVDKPFDFDKKLYTTQGIIESKKVFCVFEGEVK
jgi:uncharacterized protein YycO